MPLRVLFTIFISLLLVVSEIKAQVFPNSPYSYFGVGDIVPRGFGQQLMVGYTGLADRNPLTVNNINPASYSSITFPYTFIAETGLSISSVFRETNNTSDEMLSTSLPYLAIAFRTGGQSGASIGLRQYSNIDYNIGGEGQFTGLQQPYSVNYIGEGGINEIYFGWAKNWTKRLSVGLNGSFLFGQLNERQEIFPQGNVSQLSIDDELFVNGFNIEFGLQYLISLRRSNLILGLTIAPGTDLNEQRDLVITNAFLNQQPDTLSNESAEATLDYTLPMRLGVGASWNTSKLKLSADYTMQSWSTTSLEGTSDFDIRDSHRLSFGVQNLPTYTGDTFWERLNWGVGGYYDQSYMIVDNDPLNTIGFTAGIGHPVGRNKGIIRLIVENATRGEASNDYFRERVTRFTLSFSILESWFRKQAYD